MRFAARHRQLLILLLLPGLMLRALVPAGFMPGSGTGLGVTMELCTAHGPALYVVYPNGDTAPAPPTSQRENPCTFAVTAVVAPPPALAPVVAAVLPAPAPGTAFRSTDAPRPGIRSHSPRGPPSLV